MPSTSMSSQLDNTSAILGEYMLKGWTLTDLHCETCNITPLMREPPASAAKESRERIQFCALCDGGPSKPTVNPANASTSTSTSIPRGNDNDAAESISQLLLQGYSMLGMNCPNEGCRGIPLVGYPRKKGGERDGRRMCVGCGGRWIDEKDLGKDVNVVERSIGQPVDVGGESPRSKKRRELYDVGESIVKRNEEKKTQQASKQAVSAEDGFDLEINDEVAASAPRAAQANDDPLSSALTRTTQSLTATLTSLSSSLERHTASTPHHDQSRYFVDIKLHTEAMKDVLEVLSSIRRAQK